MRIKGLLPSSSQVIGSSLSAPPPTSARRLAATCVLVALCTAAGPDPRGGEKERLWGGREKVIERGRLRGDWKGDLTLRFYGLAMESFGEQDENEGVYDSRSHLIHYYKFAIALLSSKCPILKSRKFRLLISPPMHTYSLH